MTERMITNRLMIRSVPPSVLVWTGAASAIGLISAVIQDWPLWGLALAAGLPWLPLFVVETAWTYRHYGALALFSALVITQGGHVVEHVAQMIQMHVLHLPPAASRGIFGALDIEWVHFIWNTWVLLAVVVLLVKFRRNPWLWVTAALAGWHELEHVAIMIRYLATLIPGTPGLLARGGALGGGLPLGRPDLHFLYNVIETTPLVIAFVVQLRQSYDEWLKQAFPRVSEPVLIEASRQAQPLRFARGVPIVRQGDHPDRVYILTRGRAEVTSRDAQGRRTVLDFLHPGQYFGEIAILADGPRTATVTAATAVEVLAVDRETFQQILRRSPEAADDVDRLIHERIRRSSDR